MGRLKLQMQVTVDGRDHDGGDDSSWDEVRDYSARLLEGADTIVLGGKTAAGFIPYWDELAGRAGHAWQGVARQISAARKVVFSRSVEDPGWANTRIERGELAGAIRRLKDASAKDLVVYGGISFVASLAQARLIDEYHLFVNPVAGGRGRSIFDGMQEPLKLQLRRTIPFDSGRVLLHYE